MEPAGLLSEPGGCEQSDSVSAVRMTESSSDSSDDDLPTEPQRHSSSSHTHGMVRNYTEPRAAVQAQPLHRLSDMALSQSTWI